MNHDAGTLLRILGRLQRISGKLGSQWRRYYFIARERPFHRAMEIANSCVFDVPVTGGGRGSVSILEGVHLGFSLSHRIGSGAITIQARTPDSVISIGEGTYINNNSSLCAVTRIELGKKCLIGDSVAIYDSDFHAIAPEFRHADTGLSAPVVIEENVWVGSRAMILKGVVIGKNSVIGAMSLVNKPIPANSFAAGVPAKVIRSI